MDKIDEISDYLKRRKNDVENVIRVIVLVTQHNTVPIHHRTLLRQSSTESPPASSPMSIVSLISKWSTNFASDLEIIFSNSSESIVLLLAASLFTMLLDVCKCCEMINGCIGLGPIGSQPSIFVVAFQNYTDFFIDCELVALFFHGSAIMCSVSWNMEHRNILDGVFSVSGYVEVFF